MPIIATIGRKHWKVRAQIAGLYALLTAGAVTMVYPFLLMLAGSTKSGVDTTEFRPVPRACVQSRSPRSSLHCAVGRCRRCPRCRLCCEVKEQAQLRRHAARLIWIVQAGVAKRPIPSPQIQESGSG